MNQFAYDSNVLLSQHLITSHYKLCRHFKRRSVVDKNKNEIRNQ